MSIVLELDRHLIINVTIVFYWGSTVNLHVYYTNHNYLGEGISEYSYAIGDYYKTVYKDRVSKYGLPTYMRIECNYSYDLNPDEVESGSVDFREIDIYKIQLFFNKTLIYKSRFFCTLQHEVLRFDT